VSQRHDFSSAHHPAKILLPLTCSTLKHKMAQHDTTYSWHIVPVAFLSLLQYSVTLIHTNSPPSLCYKQVQLQSKSADSMMSHCCGAPECQLGRPSVGNTGRTVCNSYVHGSLTHIVHSQTHNLRGQELFRLETKVLPKMMMMCSK